MSAALAPVPSLIAAGAPPERRGIARDAVRMLVTDRAGGTHTHHRFSELPSLLRAGDVLVVNDSATLPAALTARRVNGERIAVHVSTTIDERLWMCEPRATVLCGEELRLPGGGCVMMIAPVDPERPRVWYAWFHLPMPMHPYLLRYGSPIRYGYVHERFPLADYQTIFARTPGSSEMPSAARPFTERIVDELRARGIIFASITLHCGIASFEAPEQPTIERYAVSDRTAQAVSAAREEGRRIIAVGSTVVRALESSLSEGKVSASSGWTGLVLDATRPITTVDAFLTGFHDAAATHQWMLQAFVDPDLLQSAYVEAASAGYYQHEFGDVHLIL